MDTARLVLMIAALTLITSPAFAQRGTGEPTGVARETVKPPIQEMSGTVTDVEVGNCEQTSGRSVMGTHLFVRTDADKQVNLHLGPLRAVEHIIEQTPVGTTLSFEAFRTEAMPADAYVAKSITVDNKVIHLRDDNLRPSWAGQRGPGAGMGRGKGMGQGGGQGMGQGRGRGACWW